VKNVEKIIMLFCFVLTFITFTSAYTAPAVGDRAEIRIWYSSSNNNNGTGLGGSISLINIESSFSDEHLFTFLLDTKGSEGNSFFSIPPDGYRIAIKIGNSKPNIVVSGSAKFINGPWITGVSSNFGFSSSQEVCFPVLPPERSYEEKDWFLVRFNDTIGMYCEYNTTQRAFSGTIKKYDNRQDSSGDPVIAGDKFMLYTKDTPFRLGAIVIHSSVSEYINKEFKDIRKGYYGLTLGSYISSNSNNQKIIQEHSKSRQSQGLRGYDGRGRIVK
jgi:hypothetical protein